MSKFYVVQWLGPEGWVPCQTADCDDNDVATVYFTAEQAAVALKEWQAGRGVYRVVEAELVINVPSVKDIHGQSVEKGDYVAYADQGYLRVLEVMQVRNTGIANCRDINTGNTALHGVFEERAIKLKDFTK